VILRKQGKAAKHQSPNQKKVGNDSDGVADIHVGLDAYGQQQVAGELPATTLAAIKPAFSFTALQFGIG
jgi:hypothetical protein